MYSSDTCVFAINDVHKHLEKRLYMLERKDCDACLSLPKACPAIHVHT